MSASPRRSAYSSRSAFTLVELLVVIGIIALLISVLLPALARARASAADLKCKSNLRSIGQAFAIYANRYGGRLPPSEMCGQSYSIGDVTVDNLNIYWFERLIGEKLLALPAIGAEEGVLVCPSQDPITAIGRARGKTPPANDARVGRFKLSYSINNFMSISDWKGAVNAYVPDGIDDDTIVMFTTDNGPQGGAWADIFVEFFDGNGPFRGARDGPGPVRRRWPPRQAANARLTARRAPRLSARCTERA